MCLTDLLNFIFFKQFYKLYHVIKETFAGLEDLQISPGSVVRRFLLGGAPDK